MPPSSYYDASPSTRPSARTKEGTSSPYYSGSTTSKSCSAFASTSTSVPQSYSGASQACWFLENHQAPILETSSIRATATSGEIGNYANVTPTVTQVREETRFTRKPDPSLHDFLPPRTHIRRTKQEKENPRNDSSKHDEEEAITLGSMFPTQPSSGLTSSTIITTSTHNASSLCDLAILADARRMEERKAAKRIANRKAASNSRARKRMQMEQLMENNASLQRYADILNALPDWILLITKDGLISFSSIHPLQQVVCPTNSGDTQTTSTNLYDILLPSSHKTLKRLIRNLLGGEDHQDREEEVDFLIPVVKRRRASVHTEKAEEDNNITIGHCSREDISSINSQQQQLEVLATAAVTMDSTKTTSCANTNQMRNGTDQEIRTTFLMKTGVVENKSEEDSSGYRPSNDSNSSTSCSNTSASDDIPVTEATSTGATNTFEKLTPTYNLCLISQDQKKQWYEVTGSIFDINVFKFDDNNNGTDAGSNDDDIIMNDSDAAECSSNICLPFSNVPNKKKKISSLTGKIASTSRSSTSMIENKTQESNCSYHPKDTRNILLCLRPLKSRSTNASKRRL